jgi:hypothetical protein
MDRNENARPLAGGTGRENGTEWASSTNNATTDLGACAEAVQGTQSASVGPVAAGFTGEPRPRGATKPFPFKPISALLEQPKPLPWLVKKYLPAEAQCMLFGAPAAGKSLLAIDWAASIATGRSWHGHRVKRGAVAYIAGEGHAGIQKRFKAWALHHQCEDALRPVPLLVSEQGAAFTDPESLESVLHALDDLRDRYGPLALVVIDTLHRNLGPGDENSSKDVGAFVGAIDTLRLRYGCSVLIVHHTGHGAQERARGSSALRAAVDAEFSLSVGASNDPRILTVTKMKDAEPASPMGFTLDQLTLPWTDDEDNPETSVVLVPTGVQVPAKGSRRDQPSRNERLALDALHAAIETSGTAPAWASDTDPPHPYRVAPVQEWRQAFYARHTGSQDAKKKAFDRARRHLVETGAVSERDGDYWPTPLAMVLTPATRPTRLP